MDLVEADEMLCAERIFNPRAVFSDFGFIIIRTFPGFRLSYVLVDTPPFEPKNPCAKGIT